MLRPGVPGLSENISRALDLRTLPRAQPHLLVRGRRGDDLLIGSADMMPRNLDHRIEVLVPIENARARQDFAAVLDSTFSDTTHAWLLAPDGTWSRDVASGGKAHTHQLTMMRRAQQRARRGDRLIFFFFFFFFFLRPLGRRPTPTARSGHAGCSRRRGLEHGAPSRRRCRARSGRCRRQGPRAPGARCGDRPRRFVEQRDAEGPRRRLRRVREDRPGLGNRPRDDDRHRTGTAGKESRQALASPYRGDGFRVRVLSSGEEGRYAYRGAVSAANDELPGSVGVVDVGGGSTEIAIGDPAPRLPG